jgi:phosphoadenosine phosphosulfate reductase
MPAAPATTVSPAPAAAADPATAFAALDCAGRFAWVRGHHAGKVVATTSFGAQSAVLLHLLATHAPEIPVVCVDTGYFFPETYQYAEELQAFLGIEVRFYTSPLTPARMEHTLGRLWQGEAPEKERYARLRKVEPLDRALKDHGAEAWLSGLRRAQSSGRGARPFVETQNRTTKIYPILDWSDARVDEYFTAHGLPRHPLLARGFVSVGDWHSTRKPAPGESGEHARAEAYGRECGLHLHSNAADFQI